MSDTELWSSVLKNYGLEAEIFYLCSGVLSIWILISVEGDLSRLEGVFPTKCCLCFKKSKNVRTYAMLFRIFVTLIVLLPLLLLIAWGTYVFYQIANSSDPQALDYFPFVAILLIGLAIICITFPILQLKWNNFQISVMNIILIILGTFSFWAFQLCTLLMNSGFLGLTAVFLTINSIFMMLLVLLYYSESSQNIKNVIEKHISRVGKYHNDPLNDDDSAEALVEREKNDPNYSPTQSEIMAVFTVRKDVKEFDSTLLNGGFQKSYQQANTAEKVTILIGTYLIALGILVIYATVVYYNTTEKSLGPLIAAAVLTTDLILFYTMKCKLSKGPTQTCILLIVFRVCLFGFGGEYLFLGYCLLYLIFVAYLSLKLMQQKGKTYFPPQVLINFLNEFLHFFERDKYYPLHMTYESFLKLKQIATRNQKIYNAIHSIQALYIFSTCLFVGVMIYLHYGWTDGAIGKEFEFYGKKYPFCVYGLASGLFGVTFFCCICIFRIQQRFIYGMVGQFNKTVLGKKKSSEYYFYLALAYGLLVLFGTIWYLAAEESLILYSFIFLPLVYEALAIFYSSWRINEFKLAANITEFNMKMNQIKDINLKKKQVQYLAMKSIKISSESKHPVEIPAQKHKSFKSYSPVLKVEPQLPNQEDYNNNNAPNDMEKQLNLHFDTNSAKKPIESLPQQQQFLNITKTDEPSFLVPQNQDNTFTDTKINLPDWRLENMSYFSAFTNRRLLSTDYRIFFGILLMLVVMIAYSIVVEFTSKDLPHFGIAISLCILSLIFIYLPIKQYFETLVGLNCYQILAFIVGVIINLGLGYFVFQILLKKDGNPERLTASHYSSYFLLYFAFIFPWNSSFYCFIRLWKDNNWSFSGKVSVIIIGLESLGFALGMGGFIIYFAGSAAGISVIVFWLFVYYGLVMFYFYKKNNSSISSEWAVSMISVVLLVYLAGLLAAVFIDSLNNFLGFSLSYLILNAFLFLSSYAQIQQDILESKQQPMFASPWIFPIFKYDAKIGIVKANNDSVLLFLASCLMFLIWTIGLTIYVFPAYVGVACSCLVEIFIFLMFIFFSTQSPVSLGAAAEYLNPEIIKVSWLKCKKIYLASKGVGDLQSVMNYNFYRNEKEAKEKQIQELIKNTSIKDSQYYSEIDRLNTELYEIDKHCRMAFQDEIKIMVHFQLLLILETHEIRLKQMKEYIDFVNDNQNELISHEIMFNQEAVKLDIEERYTEIIFQEQALSDGQHEFIKNLHQEHQQRQLDEKLKVEEAANKEEEIHKKREEEFHKKLKQKQQSLQKQQQQSGRTEQSASPAGPLGSQNHQIGSFVIDLETPLKELPDSPMKYARIIEEFKKTQKKFTDENFVAGNQIISERMASKVYIWRRPNLAASLFKDSISPLDIKQGAIGDCYLMSAMGVAGKKRIEDVFLYHEPAFDPEVRQKCGAYILKFWKNSSWIYIIVDDLLPYNSKDKLVLGQSEDENELWPAIIEKAYAKLYGGYQDIEGGKVSFALQDLTGGFPEEIILKDFRDNLDVFWSKLMDFKKYGCILGAGTPPPISGRESITKKGIVLGHAYLILDCIEIDKNKLICLRNPHGNRGQEWLGDWSDKSLKWNARLMKLAGEKAFEKDGKFWMAAYDFVYEFRAMCVCRIFPPHIWLEIPVIKGAWKGIKAAGMHQSRGRNIKLSNNPHYGIRVTNKAEVFVSLSIDETVDRNTGKVPIYFIIQKNGGKRITSLFTENYVGGYRLPTSLKILSGSFTLEASSYPYVFSMMCSTFVAQQEASFTVQIFCTDKSAKIIDDSQFDV